ncbi:hypothetical protein [Leptospira santarosai]|nr:hypothetical protein [Leptospira santarosai]
MVYTSLPAILNQNYGIKENGKKLHDKLIANDNEYKLRFVLSKGPNDHLSKSCFNVARQLDKNLRINKGIILNPSDLLTSFDPNCKYVICDDFSGTGNQFIKNIEDNGERYISLIHDNKNIIFHPMVIHEDSIKKINHIYPKIIFGYIEKLTQVNNVFSIENGIFEDGVNNIKEQGQEMAPELKLRVWSPSPATSNRTCSFPAYGFPTVFFLWHSSTMS